MHGIYENCMTLLKVLHMSEEMMHSKKLYR